MWFDGVSLIITNGPGPDNIYINMLPVYGVLICGLLFSRFSKK